MPFVKDFGPRQCNQNDIKAVSNTHLKDNEGLSHRVKWSSGTVYPALHLKFKKTEIFFPLILIFLSF